MTVNSTMVGDLFKSRVSIYAKITHCWQPRSKLQARAGSTYNGVGRKTDTFDWPAVILPNGKDGG